MFWFCYGYGGKLEQRLVRGRMSAIDYQAILTEADIVGNGELLCGENFTFQQDNASIHAVALLLVL